MKARLEPCDHTEHDAFVWAHVVLEAPGPARFGSTLWTRALMQDRNDADLMFYAQLRPHWPTVPYTDTDGCLTGHMVRGVLTALRHFRELEPL